MQASQPKSGSAVAAALARARAHAGTVAVAAVLVPLALAPRPALAVIASVNYTSITTSIVTDGSFRTFSYTVANSGSSATPIYRIELPEAHAGDFILSSFNSTLGGWTASESLTATNPGTDLKGAGTPGAYVDLVASTNNLLYEGGYATFSLTTAVAGTLESNFTSNFGFSFNGAAVRTETIDPPVPGAFITAVPEPASAAMLAGLIAIGAGVRRRNA